ncbi:MAG: hypothetical protein KDE58_30835 [Caldilineaceae bacterium]|nr:hypothetical protein [Caldilineaceae bacterium]
MNSVQCSFHFRKLVASMLVILVLQGAVIASGMQPVEHVHAADVCDGTCG